MIFNNIPKREKYNCICGFHNIKVEVAASDIFESEKNKIEFICPKCGRMHNVDRKQLIVLNKKKEDKNNESK